MYQYHAAPIHGSSVQAFQEVLDKWSKDGWKLSATVPGDAETWTVLIFERFNPTVPYQELQMAMTPDEIRKLVINNWTPTESE